MSKSGNLNRRQLLVGASLLAAQATSVNAVSAQADSKAPDLSGKSILVTGSSSGFGRLGVEYYARLGAKVFATMRNLPRPEADDLRLLAATENLSIEVIELDVLSDDLVREGVNKALKSTDGTLDFLINNAGIGITGPIEVQDMEATRLAFDTNVFGCQRMVRAVLPAMRTAGRGAIFSISSQIGRLVVPGAGHYCATKFALEALNEQLAYELVPHGVDVSIIQPGGYPTKIWVNRNRYTGELKARTPEAVLAAYSDFTDAMGKEDGTGRSTDPMDVPRAIAQIMAMPAGSRPLRQAVHPTFRPQETVNAACTQAQLKFLGDTPYGPLVRAVQD